MKPKKFFYENELHAVCIKSQMAVSRQGILPSANQMSNLILPAHPDKNSKLSLRTEQHDRNGMSPENNQPLTATDGKAYFLLTARVVLKVQQEV
jgi:hypothetical protein